jgi:hypothetical protein
MVSRRPPFLVSTSHSNERRWMSIRWGTSMACSRRAKLRRVRVASTRARTATPSRSNYGGRGGAAQSATGQYSRLRPAPSRGGYRPVGSAGAAITDPVPRPRGYVPERCSRDGCGYRPWRSLPAYGLDFRVHHLPLLADGMSATSGLSALGLQLPPRSQPDRHPGGERHPEPGGVESSKAALPVTGAAPHQATDRPPGLGPAEELTQLRPPD